MVRKGWTFLLVKESSSKLPKVDHPHKAYRFYTIYQNWNWWIYSILLLYLHNIQYISTVISNSYIFLQYVHKCTVIISLWRPWPGPHGPMAPWPASLRAWASESSARATRGWGPCGASLAPAPGVRFPAPHSNMICKYEGESIEYVFSAFASVCHVLMSIIKYMYTVYPYTNVYV